MLIPIVTKADRADEAATEGYRRMHRQLLEEQATWTPHWQELSEHQLPRKGRYLFGETAVGDVNNGKKKHSKIINGTVRDALKVIGAGLQGGLTSPSRPWFRLTLTNPDLAKFAPVKKWLHDVAQIMLMVLARSNYYAASHGFYTEICAFGTAAQLLEQNYQHVMRVLPFTIGEYCVFNNAVNRPEGLYRQLSMTARNMVGMFPWDNLSDPVRYAWNANQTERRFDLVQAIQPPTVTKGLNDAVKFEGVFYEPKGDKDTILQRSLYTGKPFVAARWDVTSCDSYGDGPGMDSLGDNKQLQYLEKMKNQALALEVVPAFNAPAELKSIGGTAISGGVNYTDMTNGQKGVTPVHEVRINLANLTAEIQNVERRVRQYYYNDLFLAILNAQDSGQRTAHEVAKIYEEKAQVLGPVLERLEGEKLNPELDRVFTLCADYGMFDQLEEPPELQGQKIKIEYMGLLMQAQKMVATGTIEQTCEFVGKLAADSADPGVWDTLNKDEAVEQFGELVGAPPRLIRSESEVKAIRAGRQEEMEQQKQMEQASVMADAAQKAGNTPMGDGTVLDQMQGPMANQMQGAN